MSTFTDLPTDIFLLILTRLTAKEILRCRAVCKEWQATITSRDFINFHLYHSTIAAENHSDINHILQLRYGHFKAAGKTYRVIGSFNGVVALGDLSGDTILVNPSTRKRIVIPYPQVRRESWTVLMGFGYDSVNKDYKLLRMINCGYALNLFFFEVMVYSLNAKTWKKVGWISETWVNPSFWHCTTAGNSIYWIARRRRRRGFAKQLLKAIVAFDLATEQCREISLPNHNLDKENDLFLNLVNLGRFGIAVLTGKDNLGVGLPQLLEAWVMVKDSWTKLFSIKPLLGFGIDLNSVSDERCNWILLYRTTTYDCIMLDTKTMKFRVVRYSRDQGFGDLQVSLPSLVGIDDKDWIDSQIHDKQKRRCVRGKKMLRNHDSE